MKIFALLIVVFAAWVLLRVDHRRPENLPAIGNSEPTEAPSICVSYPHALVRCGVSSSEQFEAERNDPSLREHYSELGLMQPALLTADEWAYASFRGPTGIVWTPSRILIRAGEYVLRDKVGNTVRARCGNRLSATPRTPVAFVMPPEIEHETPEIVMSEPPLLVGWPGKLDDFLVSPLPPFVKTQETALARPPLTGWPTAPDLPVIAALPLVIPPVISFPPNTINPPLPPPVGGAPEPHTWLLASGAALVLWISLYLTRDRANSR
jgi:hypothetical protein